MLFVRSVRSRSVSFRRGAFLLALLAGPVATQPIVSPATPQIDGAWWQVARNPDLGSYSTLWQPPVDFSIWHAKVDRGQCHIAALNPNLDGIRVARLCWAAR